MTCADDRPGVLVLGLGNLLLRDEGVGGRVAVALDARGGLPTGVEVLDGGTSGMELLDAVAEREALIVVDAIAADGPPGSVLRLEGEALRGWFRTRLSPHQIGLSDLLGLLTVSGQAPRRVVLYGVVPEDVSLGLDLSPAVADAAARVADSIVTELAMAGASAGERRGAALGVALGV